MDTGHGRCGRRFGRSRGSQGACTDSAANPPQSRLHRLAPRSSGFGRRISARNSRSTPSHDHGHQLVGFLVVESALPDCLRRAGDPVRAPLRSAPAPTQCAAPPASLLRHPPTQPELQLVHLRAGAMQPTLRIPQSALIPLSRASRQSPHLRLSALAAPKQARSRMLNGKGYVSRRMGWSDEGYPPPPHRGVVSARCRSFCRET